MTTFISAKYGIAHTVEFVIARLLIGAEGSLRSHESCFQIAKPQLA